MPSSPSDLEVAKCCDPELLDHRAEATRGSRNSHEDDSLLASKLMVKLKAALASFNPIGAVAASIGLIALGSALKAAANAAFGGGERSGGAWVPLYRGKVRPSHLGESLKLVLPRNAAFFSDDPYFQDWLGADGEASKRPQRDR